MDVPGAFEDLREIHRGGRHLVFRARRARDGVDVVLKVLAPEHAGEPDAAARLEHEYQSLVELDVPGVVKALALERAGETPALVLEDAGAENLIEWLARRSLPAAPFLDVAIALTELIARLHDRGIVHRDISPANVVMGPGGRVTLVDFDAGIGASELARQAPSSTPAAGALPYLAPEQTGRMNRLVDRRADLYSLGATFYEMLTGAPPFIANDPVELQHAHLARAPIAPKDANPNVPVVLSDIVLRLLAKMPEERYQSAQALLADLREARARLDGEGDIAPFELGLLDLARELPLPTKLYARDAERAALAAAFARARAGANEIVVLSGPAGAGKSVLAHDLGESLAGGGGQFVAAKFDLRRGNVPYAPIVAALRGLIGGVLERGNGLAQPLRQRLVLALGPSGRVISELIPELEGLLGEQPALPTLGPAETENRFRLVFHAFLQAVASKAAPLVLFVDDLQWADEASLKLVHSLVAARNLAHVMIIVAYRSDEIDSAHPLARSLSAIVDGDPRVQFLAVAPLGLGDVVSFCCDAFRCAPDRARPLAEIIVQKTAGNAFFVHRLVRHLHKTGLVVFDRASATWTWELAHIERIRVSENVAELLVQALHSLPEPTCKLLGVAACIGKHVTLGALAATRGQSFETAAQDLWAGAREGLLAPVDTGAGPLDPGARFEFVHDRVQQAAATLLLEAERQAAHLALGRHLLANTSGAQIDEHLFNIVDHLDLAVDVEVEREEGLRFAALDLQAGRKARAASASGAALEYLLRGIARLPPDPFNAQPELAFALYRDAVECAYFTGAKTQADALFAVALAGAKTRAEQAELYNIHIVASTLVGDFAAAVRSGRLGLALYGVTLPEGDPTAELLAELETVRAKLRGRTPEQLLGAPVMRDPEQLARMRLLGNLSTACMVGGLPLTGLVAARVVSLSLEHGQAIPSAGAYVLYGVTLQLMTGDHVTAGAWGRLALDLARRFGDPGQIARVCSTHAGLLAYWTTPLRRTLPLFREGQQKGIEGGDLQWAAYNAVGVAAYLYESGGELPKVLQTIAECVPFCESVQSEQVELLLTYRQAVRCLQGVTFGRNRFDDADYDDAEVRKRLEARPYEAGLHDVLRLQTSYLFGDLEQARAMSVAAEKYTPTIASAQIVHHNFYTSLTLVAAYERVAPEDPAAQASLLAAITANQQKLEGWANGSPENFRHKYLLVCAERARIAGSASEALDFYQQAIAAAAREQFLPDEALGNELCGRFHRARGETALADQHLAAAIDVYARWGATEKVRLLEEESPRRRRSPSSPWSASTGAPLAAGSAAAIDLMSVFRAAETISSEVVLDQLLSTLMELCLATAGAQRGALILEEDGELYVRALGTVAEPAALLRTPLAESRDVPRAVIASMRTETETLVLGDASQEIGQRDAEYFGTHAVRSLLALPVRRQAKFVGVLYLENNLATRVFTPDRVSVLQLLSSQIAISLENSLLFERLNREIDERKRAEAEAQRAVRLRDEFLTVASHELTTPMTSLQLTVQALELGTLPGSQDVLAKPLGLIARQTRRLRGLVDELLMVAQFEAGPLRIEREPVDLSDVVNEVAIRMREDLTRAHCTLSVEAAYPVVGLWDRTRTEQIVTRLLANAIKFAAGKPITITVEQSAGVGRLVVEDRGIGIPPERLPLIFGRFERGVSTTNYGGLGLGLFIVHEIVRALGGSVRVESAVGVGSKFVVELPCSSP